MKNYKITFGKGKNAVVVIENKCCSFVEAVTRLEHRGLIITEITKIEVIDNENVLDELEKKLEQIEKIINSFYKEMPMIRTINEKESVYEKYDSIEKTIKFYEKVKNNICNEIYELRKK